MKQGRYKMTTKEQVIEILYRLGEANDMLNVDDLLHIINMEVHEPQVKQLVWEVFSHTPTRLITRFLNNEYLICRDLKIQQWEYTIRINNMIYVETFNTLAEAKTYAQQHFEGLIKSCLEGE